MNIEWHVFMAHGVVSVKVSLKWSHSQGYNNSNAQDTQYWIQSDRTSNQICKVNKIELNFPQSDNIKNGRALANDARHVSIETTIELKFASNFFDYSVNTKYQ